MFLNLGRYLHGPGGSELDGVADEVEKHLLDGVFVDSGRRSGRIGAVEQEKRRLADQRPRDGQHQIDKRVKVGRSATQLDRFVTQFGEVKQVVDEIGEPATTGHEPFARFRHCSCVSNPVAPSIIDCPMPMMPFRGVGRLHATYLPGIHP